MKVSSELFIPLSILYLNVLFLSFAIDPHLLQSIDIKDKDIDSDAIISSNEVDNQNQVKGEKIASRYGMNRQLKKDKGGHDGDAKDGHEKSVKSEREYRDNSGDRDFKDRDKKGRDRERDFKYRDDKGKSRGDSDARDRDRDKDRDVEDRERKRDFKYSDKKDRDTDREYDDKDRNYRRYDDRKYRRGFKRGESDRYKNRKYRRNGYRSKTGKSRPYVDYCCWTGSFWDCDLRKDSSWHWVGSYFVCPPFSRTDQYEDYYD